jgi:hypothetical protein
MVTINLKKSLVNDSSKEKIIKVLRITEAWAALYYKEKNSSR